MIRSSDVELTDTSTSPTMCGIPVSVQSYERLRCNAPVVTEHEHADGTIERSRPVDVIPRCVRRAVMRRDNRQCRWPGCMNRARIEVHHIKYRRDGGAHDLQNLACLCDVHHHAVHDRGWTITGNANGPLEFTSPQGRIATETQPVITLTTMETRVSATTSRTEYHR